MDLGCFAKNGMDFSRMNSPFMLATDGPMNLSLSDIRLIPGPPGGTRAEPARHTPLGVPLGGFPVTVEIPTDP